MKKTMKTSRLMFGLAVATGTFWLVLPPKATAQVSATDFNAVKEMVQKLSEQVQSLTQSNLVVLQMHEKDQQQIKELQEKLAVTQQTAATAEQQSMAAAQAQAQPPPRMPLDEATVNRNFQILGDAEFQYVNADHQNGAFLLGDFAPIFLYRGGENM
jgi:hypothetical protein